MLCNGSLIPSSRTVRADKNKPCISLDGVHKSPLLEFFREFQYLASGKTWGAVHQAFLFLFVCFHAPSLHHAPICIYIYIITTMKDRSLNTFTVLLNHPAMCSVSLHGDWFYSENFCFLYFEENLMEKCIYFIHFYFIHAESWMRRLTVRPYQCSKYMKLGAISLAYHKTRK